jgi:hypothetical protein
MEAIDTSTSHSGFCCVRREPIAKLLREIIISLHNEAGEWKCREKEKNKNQLTQDHRTIAY